MQFAGGFADVIVDKVKAEEAQAREDESWDRRFQKQQDAINSRTRGDKRRAAEEAAAELAEKLSIHYKPEQVVDILSNGTQKAQYALSQAEAFANDGLSASVGYGLPMDKIKKGVQSKYAFSIDDIRGSQTSPAVAKKEMEQINLELTAAKEAVPFAERFTRPDPKIQTDAKTYQARLIEIDTQLLNDPDNASLLELKKDTLKLYEEFKIAGADKKETDWSLADGKALDVLFDNAGQRVLANYVGLYEEDVTTKYKKIRTGNEHDVLFYRSRVNEAIRKEYVEPNVYGVHARNKLNVISAEFAEDKSGYIEKIKEKTNMFFGGDGKIKEEDLPSMASSFPDGAVIRYTYFVKDDPKTPDINEAEEAGGKPKVGMAIKTTFGFVY